MQNLAIKYRIYPNNIQQSLIARTFGCCRKVWNLMLSDWKKSGLTGGFPLSPARYKQNFPYLREVDSLALCNVQMQLKQAVANHKKNWKHFSEPGFKSRKHGKRSYTTNCCNGNIVLLDNAVRLPKLGDVKAVIHRLPEDGWKLKAATVSQAPDGRYYASMLFEMDVSVLPAVIDESMSVGLDYKSEGLYMDSNGYQPGMPKYYDGSHRKLAREQKRLSRKEGSRKNEERSCNWYKQYRKVMRVHARIANQRRDFLHKKSSAITKQYDIICIEELNMKGIACKDRHLGKATMGNAWGMFTNMLSYKQEREGHLLIKVSRWFPSTQLCSRCGSRQKLRLGERTYRCPSCGLVMDRDLNSSVNILHEGLRMYHEAITA